jgi:hypothetical protein
MRDALRARHRDPAEIGVLGSLPAVRDDRDRLDLGRTMAPVSRLHAAGVSIFHLNFSAADQKAGRDEILGAAVAAFRAATA